MQKIFHFLIFIIFDVKEVQHDFDETTVIKIIFLLIKYILRYYKKTQKKKWNIFRACLETSDVIVARRNMGSPGPIVPRWDALQLAITKAFEGVN